MKQVLKISTYIILALVFQEVVLRICFPVPEVRNFDRIHAMQFNQINNYHLRNRTWYWQSVVDTSTRFSSMMNLYGFRDKDWPVKKKQGKQRILFIGDSFVEGIMADQKETIPAGYKNADQQDEFEVWNGGMMGVGLSSYGKLLADAAPTFHPDVVFICIFSNDLGQTKPQIPSITFVPELTNSSTPRVVHLLEEYRDRGPVLFRCLPEEQNYLPKSDKPNNPWYTNESVLSKHVSVGMAKMMKNATFNPFKTNTLFKEEKYLKQLPKLGQFLPFVKRISEKFNFKLIVVYIPSRSQVTTHYYQFERSFCQQLCPDTLNLTTSRYQLHQRTLAEDCENLEIPFIDLTQEVRNEEQSGEHLYWNYDEHMRGKGYLFLGNRIWERSRKFLKN